VFPLHARGAARRGDARPGRTPRRGGLDPPPGARDAREFLLGAVRERVPEPLYRAARRALLGPATGRATSPRTTAQAENEDPQPQVWVGFGFTNLNPPPCRLLT